MFNKNNELEVVEHSTRESTACLALTIIYLQGFSKKNLTYAMRKQFPQRWVTHGLPQKQMLMTRLHLQKIKL